MPTPSVNSQRILQKVSEYVSRETCETLLTVEDAAKQEILLTLSLFVMESNFTSIKSSFVRNLRSSMPLSLEHLRQVSIVDHHDFFQLLQKFKTGVAKLGVPNNGCTGPRR